MRPITATSSRRRRPASAKSSSPSMRRATANCRTIVGKLTVLPKHWWEGTDAQGRKRDISATTLEKPLGSGAYRIKEFVAGRTVVLERVKDYWGTDLPTQHRPEQFRRDALRIFSRRQCCARGVQGRPGRLAHRKQRQEMGDRLRFPGGRRQAGASRKNSRSRVRAACRRSRSICGATSSRIRGCAARSIMPTISRR